MDDFEITEYMIFFSPPDQPRIWFFDRSAADVANETLWIFNCGGHKLPSRWGLLYISRFLADIGDGTIFYPYEWKSKLIKSESSHFLSFYVIMT